MIQNLANAPSQAHSQGTQSRHTEANLSQKSLPCANAQATLYGWTQTHIVDNRERANVQQKYCCKWGLTL